jgi:hypothetical protein
MKITTKSQEAGGTLILTLFTCLTVGIVLGSFLTLISARNKVTMRSTAWNAAIPVLEAGIEEAMTHLKKVRDDHNMTGNGWTASIVGGQPVHVKKRTLPDGSYYNVTIYNGTTDAPFIYSQGFVPSPLESGKYISRLVRVGATNPPNVFTKGIVTTGKITLGGNAIVDGYDSALGPYNVLSNRLANGGVGTVYNGASAINVGNAKIYGVVSTGPAGKVTIGSGGAVGDVAWVSGSTGIKPGWSDNNMNFAFPTNSPPTGGPFLAPIAVGNTITLGTGTNQMSSYSGGNGKKIIVTGHATLYVTGDFTLTGNAYVEVQPGGSLTIYVGGDAKFGGNGVVNQTGLPSNVSVIGLSGNKNIAFSGGADFYGTVNAPNADINVNGNGSFYGAIIGKSYTAIGNGAVHYDKALVKPGDLLVASWKEL